MNDLFGLAMITNAHILLIQSKAANDLQNLFRKNVVLYFDVFY